MGQLGPRSPKLPLMRESKAIFFSFYSAFSEDRNTVTATTSSSRRDQYQEVLGWRNVKLGGDSHLPSSGEVGQKVESPELKDMFTSNSSLKKTPLWFSDTATLRKQSLYQKLIMMVGKGACLHTWQPEFDTRAHNSEGKTNCCKLSSDLCFSTWALLQFSTWDWDMGKHSVSLSPFLIPSITHSFSLSPSINK